MQKAVVQAELAHPTMQGAAMGLTCKDALAIFSQNETLALQRRVSELEEELAEFVPPVKFSDKEITAKVLMERIKTRFDVICPPETRHKPVQDEDDVEFVLGSVNGCIWGGWVGSWYDGVYSEGGPNKDEDQSLMGIVKQELVSALGDSCRAYCDTQCDNIVFLLAHALKAGYTGGGWVNFEQQERQECIIWNALFDHLTNMPYACREPYA